MFWTIDESDYIESVHNYIDFDAGIIRKGAISEKNFWSPSEGTFQIYWETWNF